MSDVNRAKDRTLEFQKLEASAYFSLANETEKASQTYGALTIRLLVLANGAAAIAVLGLMANIAGLSIGSDMKQQLVAALSTSPLWFAWGLMAAILAAALGYINFQAIAASLPNPWQVTRGLAQSNNPIWPESWARHLITPTARLAVVACTLSSVLFLIGAYKATGAFAIISN